MPGHVKRKGGRREKGRCGTVEKVFWKLNLPWSQSSKIELSLLIADQSAAV
jgi:hypothetical protein